jgi:hypothetical protein
MLRSGALGLSLATRRWKAVLYRGVGATLVQVRRHAHQDRAERTDVRLCPVAGGVVTDDRLQRVTHLVVVGHAGLGPLKTHDHGPAAHAGGGTGDEHPAAGTGSRLDQPAGVEQFDRLVDGGHRDVEPLAQVVLGPEPVAGVEDPGGDVLLDLARESLSPGQAGILQNALSRRHRK